METASLVRACDHARAHEHVSAAGEFANASRQTSSIEALRTLKLLEDHHRRIAELLKAPPESSVQTADAETADPAPPASAQRPDPRGTDTDTETVSKPPQPPRDVHVQNSQAQVPSLAQKRRLPSRDPTSSIASNLASARGIRSTKRGQVLSPSVSNDQAAGGLEVPPRVGPSKSTRETTATNDHAASQGYGARREDSARKPLDSARRSEAKAPASEDGYNRFYNTVGSIGSILGRISAPLAFAGLPLISEESGSSATRDPAPEPTPASRRNRLSRAHGVAGVAAEPELSKIFSKATLRAISKDGHGTANDSFYVVPTSGHTVSYANILTFAEKEKRRMGADAGGTAGGGGSSASTIGDDEEEEFVDAREPLVQLSPGARRRAGRARSEKDLSNTIEELYLENKSLKDALDNLSRRLHAFEASAQNSTMALAESFRLMRPASPASVAGAGAGSEASLRQQVQELEEKLTPLTRDNEKMRRTLDKYREKWDLLKAGAKARREAQGVAAENAEG